MGNYREPVLGNIVALDSSKAYSLQEAIMALLNDNNDRWFIIKDLVGLFRRIIMMTYFDLSICFFLRAPILASSGASNSQGVDNTFFRDSNGKIALQRSHIKGKLRESLLDLDNIYKIEGFSMDEWFGTRIEDDAFDRSTSKLIFSDFLLDHTELLNTSIATRVSINNKTGTTKERFLQMNEQLFAPGSLSRWIGHIYFWAESKTAADNIASIIKLGFKWITGIWEYEGKWIWTNRRSKN